MEFWGPPEGPCRVGRVGCVVRAARSGWSGRKHNNLKERRLAAYRLADHRHRRQRLGQVEPGLRHDLRRRPAALCRVAVGLRPPVPGADGEARRRPDRGHLPGHRDSPEEQHPQSPIDGGHHHRNPRLHAPALGARRPHVLPQLRPRGVAETAESSRGACSLPGHAAGGVSRCPSHRADTRCRDLEDCATPDNPPHQRRRIPCANSASLANAGSAPAGAMTGVTLERWTSRGQPRDPRGERRSRGRGFRRPGRLPIRSKPPIAKGRRRFRARVARPEAYAPSPPVQRAVRCRRCLCCTGRSRACSRSTIPRVPDVPRVRKSSARPRPCGATRPSRSGGAIEPWPPALPRGLPRSSATPTARRARHSVAGFDRRSRRSSWKAMAATTRAPRVLAWLERKKYKVHVGCLAVRGYLTCPDCGGTRPGQEHATYAVGKTTIARRRDRQRGSCVLRALALSEHERPLPTRCCARSSRLAPFLRGPNYCTGQVSSTLSGGSSQRITWDVVGSALVDTRMSSTSVHGLHPRDNFGCSNPAALREQVNTLLVVEHDAT